MVDFTFITERLAVGGGIWTRENFEELQRHGFTHIINTQIEFDDRALRLSGDPSAPLGMNHEPVVLDLGMDDDYHPKPAELFFRGVRFALAALEQPQTKLLVHCASGIHRGPMVALAILRALGTPRLEALWLLRARRPQVDFPEVYLDSVEAFLADWDVRETPA